MISLVKYLQKTLVDEKIIDHSLMEKMIAEAKTQGVLLTDQLIQDGIVSESKLVFLIVEKLGQQPLDFSDFKIEKRILEAIPKTIAVHYQVIPIIRLGRMLILAMVNPSDVLTMDHVKALTGFQVHPISCSSKDIEKGIGLFYEEDTSRALEEIMKDMPGSESMELLKDLQKSGDRDRVEKFSEDAPTIRLTDAIIKQGVATKASDIFIEPLQKALRIRYRIDGVIREVDRMSKALHFPIVSRIKIISNLDIAEHRLPQDGRFKILTDKKKEVDFRVSILPTALGEKVVLRVLDKNAEMIDLSKLGFDTKALATLKDCAQKPHGMILACGPTGSGKTTTLYSILKFIDSPEKNIITVEDPVEYQMKGINQVNIKAQVNLSFASALRAILRQDPDIIMVGEIRDHETMDVAVKAALTGHLVLSSLHTTTAAGSIIRMVNMGIEPFLICSSVLVVVAQRLLRKLCDQCKEPFEVSDLLSKKIGLTNLHFEKKGTFFKPKGCDQCFNLGYKGRIGVTEIMVLSPAVKKFLLERVGEFKIKELARKEGMSTMREDALRKAALGLTSIEEVLRITSADEEMSS
jgi:type IV pilus assembly protein PilB